MKRSAVLVAAAAASSLLGGCSSGGTAGTTTTTSVLTVPLPTLPGTQVAPNGTQYLIVGGKKVTLPRQHGTRGISPEVDMGQQLMITTEGFWPRQLFAPIAPITFTNVTDKQERITLEHLSVTSPEISPAGGTWTWTPKSLESVGVVDTSGQSAIIDVGELES